MSPTTPPQNPAKVKSHQKISATQGGLGEPLPLNGHFGTAVTSIDDFDGDGVHDVVVGAPGSMTVRLLFLNAEGTVDSEQKIGFNNAGGFTGTLIPGDYFGVRVASLGDLDGDGVDDLAVGAIGDGHGFENTGNGAVWMLFLNADGTVKSHQKINATEGGFTGTLDPSDGFGSSVVPLGDFDGDEITELAVGAFGDDDGGFDRGAIWVLFLNSNGTVKSQQKISDTQGGLTGTLADGDNFGVSSAALGDLDGDGVCDLAVGGHGAGGISKPGAVWMLLLNSDGTVKSHQRISNSEGGFNGTLDDGDLFGISVAVLDDLNNDGIADLAVGAAGDDDGGGYGRGAAWLLFLESDRTVKVQRKISSTHGGFTGSLGDGDLFGSSLSALEDLDGDGFADLAVGAPWDDDGGTDSDTGAIWVLFLGGELENVRRFTGTVSPGGTISLPIGGGSSNGHALYGKYPPNPPGSIPMMIVGTRSTRNRWNDPIVDPRSVVGIFAGGPWLGGGDWPIVEIRIPNDPRLLGVTLHAQGFLFDPWRSQKLWIPVSLPLAIRIVE